MANRTSEQLLRIDPVHIPGSLSPIQHPENPHVGVPIALHLGGILNLLIDPWVNMSLYDTAAVHLNGSPTSAIKVIRKEEELDKQFEMELPADLLRNGINLMVLVVTRLSQPDDPQSSLPLRVLYHRPRPGGEISGSGTNPDLLLLPPPDVVATGVDDQNSAQGIPVQLLYSAMRTGDTITCSIDDVEFTHVVTEAEATAGIAVIILTTSHFPRDNPRSEWRFRVKDLLGNSSGPLAIWSAITYIDVHIRQPALDLRAPKVVEAREDNGKRLNFVQDFYYAHFATVEVEYPGSAPGQSVTVDWTVRNNTYGSETQSITVAGQKLRFLVPRVEVVDAIGSGARIRYTVRLPGTTTDLPSRPLDITVTGQKYHLPEPTINAAMTNLRTYYPELDGAYKVRISLTVGTTRYDSAEFVITHPSQTDVAIPSNWITPNKGKLGLFNFTLKRTGTSEPINFSRYLRVKL